MKRILTVLLLSLLIAMTAAVPAMAYTGAVDFAADGNVIDLAGVMTAEQEAYLEAKACEISASYGCGIYVVTTADYTQLNLSIVDAVINLYHDNKLGEGAGRDGILLLMDPVNREFAFFVYGENAEYIFDAYGQEQLEKVFLDDFTNDVWYDGFEDFVLECERYMELAAQGEPVRRNVKLYYGGVIVVGVVIALFSCLVGIHNMKSVAMNSEASVYMTSGLVITARSDEYTHKTETMHSLRDDDDSSSDYDTDSFTGGGGSGRSGSF